MIISYYDSLRAYVFSHCAHTFLLTMKCEITGLLYIHLNVSSFSLFPPEHVCCYSSPPVVTPSWSWSWLRFALTLSAWRVRTAPRASAWRSSRKCRGGPYYHTALLSGWNKGLNIESFMWGMKIASQLQESAYGWWSLVVTADYFNGGYKNVW